MPVVRPLITVITYLRLALIVVLVFITLRMQITSSKRMEFLELLKVPQLV